MQTPRAPMLEPHFVTAYASLFWIPAEGAIDLFTKLSNGDFHAFIPYRTPCGIEKRFRNSGPADHRLSGARDGHVKDSLREADHLWNSRFPDPEEEDVLFVGTELRCSGERLSQTAHGTTRDNEIHLSASSTFPGFGNRYTTPGIDH